MRWPLKNQVIIRMLLLLLLTIGAITFANIRAVIAADRLRERTRIEQVAMLLRQAQFPLTKTVLENMKLLSGAEFAVTNQANQVIEATADAPTAIPRRESTPAPENRSGHANVAKIQTAKVNGRWYYYTVVRPLRQPNASAKLTEIHVYVSRQSESAIWWQASKSPLLIAIFAMPVTLLVSFAFASQVTSPLVKLRQQVMRISDGDLQPLSPLRYNDEIRDLNSAINEMAEKLSDHDNQLRQNERLNARVQFGSGIAHHLRNSVTGCRLAVELLSDDYPEMTSSENYQVAIRQLTLMNNYIKKFMSFAKSSPSDGCKKTEMCDLPAILERVIFLLRPSALHLGVELKVDSAGSNCQARFAEEDAEQMMLNLIGNAITAASELKASSSFPPAFVRVRLFRSLADSIVLEVADNGVGPPLEIADHIFEPFVTGSREGTGLGLSLVRDIALRSGGVVDWKRADDTTVFTFEF